TSSAAPVVTGVVALLLSKNGMLTYEEVKTALANGADKSGNYIYQNAAKQGHSKEMGYGRVNAYKTLEDIPVGITENSKVENFSIKVTNPVMRSLDIRYDISALKGDVEVQIYDMSGNVHYSKTMYRHEEFVSIDVNDLSPGMYFSRFMNKEDELVQTVKFIKLW